MRYVPVATLGFWSIQVIICHERTQTVNLEAHKEVWYVRDTVLIYTHKLCERINEAYCVTYI